MDLFAQHPASNHSRLGYAKSSAPVKQESGQIEQNEIRNELAILLLAAGSSSRMGQSKQLLPIEGEPLLLRTAKVALRSQVTDTVVVLGANAQKHEAVIKKLPVTIIVNEEWEKGMGHSLKVGLHHLIQSYPQLNAVLITVCDQPLLTTHHLDKLIDTYRKTKQSIIASFYKQVSGVPALFDQSLFSQLQLLDDHQGAKKIIEMNKHLVYPVAFVDGAIDLDTWEEYMHFKSTHLK